MPLIWLSPAMCVIDGGGSMERALCSEIMISHAPGASRFIINGCIRDIDAIADGFPRVR